MTRGFNHLLQANTSTLKSLIDITHNTPVAREYVAPKFARSTLIKTVLEKEQ